MRKYKFGDIVLVNFPFSDLHRFKRRPALVLSDTEDGDILICRISTKIYATKFDMKIITWKDCGLLLPSILRVHKIVTIENKLIELKMGRLDSLTMTQVKSTFKKLVV